LLILQSIGTLLLSIRRFYSTNNHTEASNLKNIDSPGRIRTPVTGSKDVKINKFDYRNNREGFKKWMNANCSTEHSNAIVAYLDRYLTTAIDNPIDLFFLIENVKKGKRQFSMGIRDLLKYLEAFSLIDEDSLIRYRKVVKIPKANTDNFVPDDEQVISALNKIEDKQYRLVYKLLVYSGIRLREGVYLLNNYRENRIITNGVIAKYPLSLERKTKKVYYAYMPEEFSYEVKRLDLKEPAVRQHIARRQLASKYLRKWHYNFLISNNVPESVSDYIQGRSPSTVGSMHYLAKTQQADLWYGKVVDKLLDLLK
jgi:intergrase/recombinase